MSWLDSGLLEGKGKKERSRTAHCLAARAALEPPREPGRLERKEARVEASEGAWGELYGGPGLSCSWAAESLFEKERAGPTPGTGVARLTPALRAQWPLVFLGIRVFVGVWNLSI